jgi:PAS domain S-box-containing protein
MSPIETPTPVAGLVTPQNRGGLARRFRGAPTVLSEGDSRHKTVVHKGVSRPTTANETPGSEMNAIGSLSDPGEFPAFFDVMPDAIVVCDDDGRIIFVNRKAEHLTGYGRGELNGRRVEMLIPADARVAHVARRKGYSEQPVTRGMGTDLNLHVRCLDGTDIPVDIALSPIETVEGLRIVAVIRDMRERLRIEARLKAEADAEMIRAKDELISLVSHEMRTPLASIVGFAELLLTRESSADQRRRYLEIMLQEAKRLTSLINDFLDLQRLEGGHHKVRNAETDMALLVQRAVDGVLANPKTPIRISFPTDLPMVVVDPDALLQVVTNLLSNACKYSPEGGEIVLSGRMIGESVEVSVEDHGIGLEPDEMNRLFDKFYRAERAERLNIKGTGLGLAICRRIVEGHGGSINATSDGTGRGSTFKFTVPISISSPLTAEVLLVEDDHAFAKLLGVELDAQGLTSIWAPKAEIANELIETGVAKAVLLDLVLPALQGEEFLLGLRTTHGSSIPVVIVTMKPLGPAEQAALKALGATAILGKNTESVRAAAALLRDALKP